MFLLQLRNELYKLFGKKRTWIGFGVFLVVQNLILIAFHYSKWERNTGRMLDANGYAFAEYISALTVAMLMLLPQIIMLMPLYVTLVGGDIVAKEVEDGTLRMILSRPISRLRLLFVKWAAGGFFSIMLVLALGGMALFFARCWFPWGGMFFAAPGPSPIFNVMPAGEGLKLYAIAQMVLAINAFTMFSLAFMLSCFNMKPAAATILAMSFLLLNLVFERLPFFDEYKEFALTHHFGAWLLVFSKPVQFAQIVQSFCVLIAVNGVAFVIGATNFQMRDIKS